MVSMNAVFSAPEIYFSNRAIFRTKRLLENVNTKSYPAHVEYFPRLGPRAQLLHLSSEKKSISKLWISKNRFSTSKTLDRKPKSPFSTSKSDFSKFEKFELGLKTCIIRRSSSRASIWYRFHRKWSYRSPFLTKKLF